MQTPKNVNYLLNQTKVLKWHLKLTNNAQCIHQTVCVQQGIIVFKQSLNKSTPTVCLTLYIKIQTLFPGKMTKMSSVPHLANLSDKKMSGSAL